MAIIIAKTNQNKVARTHMVEIMSIASCANLGESDHVLRAQQDIWAHVADNLYGDEPHESLSDIHEQVAALDVDDVRWAISHSVNTGFIVNLAVPRLIEVDYDGYDSDEDFDDAAAEEGGKAAAVSDDACDIVTVYVRDMAELPNVMAEVGATQTLKFEVAYRYAPNKEDLLPIAA